MKNAIPIAFKMDEYVLPAIIHVDLTTFLKVIYLAALDSIDGGVNILVQFVVKVLLNINLLFKSMTFGQKPKKCIQSEILEQKKNPVYYCRYFLSGSL